VGVFDSHALPPVISLISIDYYLRARQGYLVVIFCAAGFFSTPEATTLKFLLP